MNTTIKRRWIACLQVGVLVIAGSLFGMACDQEQSPKPTKADEERWKNFQETNKTDVSSAQSSFEKRQQQLAEKKKADANKTNAAATPPAAPPAKKD